LTEAVIHKCNNFLTELHSLLDFCRPFSITLLRINTQYFTVYLFIHLYQLQLLFNQPSFDMALYVKNGTNLWALSYQETELPEHKGTRDPHCDTTVSRTFGTE